MPQPQPAGRQFTVDGACCEYSNEAHDAQVVSFTAGGDDGWRGARIDDGRVFREDLSGRRSACATASCGRGGRTPL